MYGRGRKKGGEVQLTRSVGRRDKEFGRYNECERE